MGAVPIPYNNAMTRETDPKDYKALMSDALVLLRETQAKLAALEARQHEPIAVVGMGVRAPGGVDSPRSFWRFLAEGTDAVSEVPPDRWDLERFHDPDYDAPGRIVPREASFLDDVSHFDPLFFGISPREAHYMDPQQRILLEVNWEALENACIAPSALSSSNTGVFVGVTGTDYAIEMCRYLPYEEMVALIGTGVNLSIAAGRISYSLGLQGPCFVVNTACSSSLAALHTACESLRRGECDVGLCSGVNLLLSPLASMVFSNARMLSPDGRCKAFDSRGDGYGRGEGAVALVLKRASDARRDGDRILAEILGSAMNQDGASGGITVPSGPAQEVVLRQALGNARVRPADVSFVEAHGTGTPLGDPIEMAALGAVYGEGRDPANPVRVSSVKTNLGHTEAAAGLMGVAKVIAQLEHRALAPHVHLRDPNPHIPWERLPVEVVRELGPWETHGAPRIAGVSSFGFSGTNVHAVLREGPTPTPAPPGPEGVDQVIALSARSEERLRALAERYVEYLATTPEVNLADLACATTRGRSHFRRRLAIPAGSTDEVRERLAAWLGGATEGVREGEVPGRVATKAAWILDGEALPSRELAAAYPAYAEALTGCATALGRGDLFSGDDGSSRTAAGIALAALWRSFGLTPSAVLGTGAGTRAAAHVAGALDLPGALGEGPLGEPRIPLLDAADDLEATDCRVFLGLGASRLLGDLRARQDLDGVWLDGSEAGRIPGALADAYVAGQPLDWVSAWRGRARPPIELPTYPFERQLYWAIPEYQDIGLPMASLPTFDFTVVGWRRSDRSNAAESDGTPSTAGTWLLVARPDGPAAGLAGALEERGARVEFVPDDAALATRLAAPGEVRAVLHGRSFDGPDVSPDPGDLGGLTAACGSLLGTIQACARRASPPRLFLLTRAAQSPGAQSPANGAPETVDPVQTALWGLGRTAAAEHPELACTRVDLAQAADPAAALPELLADPGEDEVVLRGEARYVARLQPLEAKPAPEAPVRADATYLVTGGVGALGLITAKRLVELGARRLVLVGRSANRAAAREEIEAIEGCDAVNGDVVEILVRRCDVSDAGAVEGLLAEIADGARPVRGIVHAAGVLDDGVLLEQTPERFATVLAPKAIGAWNLHVATRDLPLDFFVLYSSSSAVLGSPGQGNYVTANSFLDGLANLRRSERRAATSIAWGAWAEVGMAARVEDSARRIEAMGMRAISPSRGAAALEELLKIDAPQAGFFSLDWRRFGLAVPVGTNVVRLEDYLGALPSALEGTEPELVETLRGHAGDDLGEAVLAYLARAAGRVLRIPADSVDTAFSFPALGMDSLLAVELRNRVQADLTVTLPMAEILSERTVEELVPIAVGLLAEAGVVSDPERQLAGDESLLDEIENLSDEEVERLLAQGEDG